MLPPYLEAATKTLYIFYDIIEMTTVDPKVLSAFNASHTSTGLLRTSQPEKL
jgi:hypothetical protein